MHSYEDMAALHAHAEACEILEAMSPVSVGRWYDAMTFRLQKMIQKYRKSNPEYADMLTKYWTQWSGKGQEVRDMSPEGFDYLSGSAQTMSTMDWPEASFFQGIIMTLNSVAQDIRGSAIGAGNAERNEPFMGGAGASTPPMGTDFGPEDQAPPGAEQPLEPGAEGQPGKPPAPGEGPTPPGEEKPETPMSV
jgi:hypothetical protein